MNQTLAWMLAAVLSLSLISSATAQDAKQRTGKVVRIKGDARFSTGNKVWQPLKVGTTLKSGYIVQTAPNSFADIVINEDATAAAVAIAPVPASTSSKASSAGGGGGGAAVPAPDQDVIRVLDDTYLVFDSLAATATGADVVTETMLDLKKGSIFGSVKKQAAASRFEIKTPNGVAGIRGTWFLIDAFNNVSCLAGSVIAALTDAAGNVTTHVIGGGQSFNAGTKQISPLAGALMSNMTSMANDCNPPSNNNGRGRGRGHGGKDHGHDHVSKHKP